MFDLPVKLAAQYGSVVEARYTVPRPAISLHAHGITVYQCAEYALENPGPFVVVHPALAEVYLEDLPTRRSYTVQVETQGLRASTTAGMVDVESGGRWFALPGVTRLTREQAVAWEAEFRRLCWWFNSPLAQDQFRVRLGFADLFRRLVDRHLTLSTESPAARFKRMIDEDERGLESLDSLSRACGYSPNHLRVLFQSEYGMSPLAYRNHIRMARAIQLLQNTLLPVKTIAARTGFRHVSHFSRMFRQTFGSSPRESMRRLRQR